MNLKRILCVTMLLALLLLGSKTMLPVSAATVTPTVSSYELYELRAGGGSGGGGSSSGRGIFSRYRRRQVRRKLANGEPLNLFDYTVILVDYVLIPVVGVGFCAASFTAVRKKAKRRKAAKKILEKLSNADNAWKFEHLYDRVSKTYYAVQKAWGKGDMTPAKEYMTVELFEQYQQRLDAMHSRNERNILKNIKLDNYHVEAVFDSDDDTHDNAWFFIAGSMTDYIYSYELKRITEGTTNITSFVEYWKFMRDESGEWVLAKIIQENDKANLPF